MMNRRILPHVDPTDTLLIWLPIFGNNGPNMIVKNNKLSKLADWVDVQLTVYQCVKSGASPINTNEDHKHL